MLASVRFAFDPAGSTPAFHLVGIVLPARLHHGHGLVGRNTPGLSAAVVDKQRHGRRQQRMHAQTCMCVSLGLAWDMQQNGTFGAPIQQPGRSTQAR